MKIFNSFSKDIRKDFVRFCGRCFGNLSDDAELNQVQEKSKLSDDEFIQNSGYLEGHDSVSKDIKGIIKFCGRCFGNLLEDKNYRLKTYVPVNKDLNEDEDFVESVGLLVGDVSDRVDSFICSAVDDILDFTADVGNFIADKHLPPSPCCVIISVFLDKLDKYLDGKPHISEGCSYHT
ncbi:hypothetical protein MCHI_001556 [Candidatus Magnetoovum chiemensis]|nr:hypothetical protein MCHI_001556 [Candidatus Magnetoovum chiemensis]